MPDATQLSTDHYLDLDDGKFAGTSKADLDQLFTTLAGDPDRNTLVVHFHGGNVSRKEGVEIAQRLLSVYRDAGAYPVFFIWNSSIGEVLGKMRASIARPLWQQVRGIFSWSAFRTLFKPQTRALPYRAAFALYRTAYALYRIAKRFATGRSHGVRATIVEEFLRAFFVADFGFAVWSLMKREIVHAFGADANTCGGTAFLLGLQQLWNKGWQPRIILVAHSGGSIYVCQFLENAAKHLPDAKFDVIFLAAAVTTELFQETLSRHGARIKNFRSFALKDPLESKDPLDTNPLIAFIYPRSLLYFMSGVCEQEDRDAEDIGDVPLAGMQRYCDNQRVYRDDDIKAVRSFLAKPKYAVWSVEDSGFGSASNNTTHVGFDNDRLTLCSLQHIIRKGF